MSTVINKTLVNTECKRNTFPKYSREVSRLLKAAIMPNVC